MPAWLATILPLWNKKSAGIPLTPNFAAFIESVSVLTFAIVTGDSAATCSNIGPNALQGPHHGANRTTHIDSSKAFH